MSDRPFYVYDNWSAYDELSDRVPLTQALSEFQLEQVVRLRSHGVRIDAYLMDAFWYAPEAGYREWRGDRWPNGPAAWIQRVRDAGLECGLWFPANTAFHMEPPETWRDSLAANAWGFCCFAGGFLSGFLDVLEFWYDQGVTVFKLDFADFDAIPVALEGGIEPSQARLRNVEAFREGLLTFRQKCTKARFLGYNGFEDAEYMSNTGQEVASPVDPVWLTVLDSVYSGDPRPADVPQPSFWRSCDIYADHTVRTLRESGLPYERIDNCALMLGVCGTCYSRGVQDWRGTALLSLARKGQVHMLLGNLELLSDEDARYLADLQRTFEGAPEPEWVGGSPGKGELYGYRSGHLLTLVNAGLEPVSWPESGRVVFGEGAWRSWAEELELGAGAVVLIDTREAGEESCGAGLRLHALPHEAGRTVASSGDLHIVARLWDADHRPLRVFGGAPPDGQRMDEVIRLEVEMSGVRLPVIRPDAKVVWSGMSWAYGVVSACHLNPGASLTVTVEAPEGASIGLELYNAAP